MAGKRILVAVAWPYANGPLHLGHVAGSLLPPDIFARYHRMAGSHVLMVSGSDMHGTPITVKAEQEGIAPQALAKRYHEQHLQDLASLAIDFGGPGQAYGPWGLFTSTATPNHAGVAQDVFRTLLAKGHIAKRTMRAPYDPKAKRFLPDRYVEGTCPHCAFPDARGDQCDSCGRTLDPQDLKDPRSKLSGAAPEYRDTEHFFLLLPHFQAKLQAWSEAQAAKAGWRANTINFTRNWLQEGLQDRAITRDMTYGVPLPPEVEAQGSAFAEKRIYVWFEAVIGYLSAAKEWATRQGKPEAWKEWWLNPETRHYYFLGKDNIPFHTIIWPAMILGYAEGKGESYQLPWDVPANEFMTFAGSKLSKSRGNLILVQDITQRFEADAVRYYLTINMPEGRDANFLWEEFARKNNEELVAALGNFCHRTLSFAQQHWQGVPDSGSYSPSAGDVHFWKQAEEAARNWLVKTTENLERCQFKDALRNVMALATNCNFSFNSRAPWKSIKEHPGRAAYDIHQMLRFVKTLAQAMAPFLPRGAEKLWVQLGEQGSVHAQPWTQSVAELPPGRKLPMPTVLFPKIGPEHLQDLVGEPVPNPTGSAPPAVLKQKHPATDNPLWYAKRRIEVDPNLPSNPSAADPAAAPAASPGPAAASTPGPPTGAKPPITLEQFQQVDLRVGVVTSIEDHPKADKLYVVKVDLGGGEERQLVAGLRAHVPREKLLGQRVIVVANLQPAKLRGVESQGMLLAAEIDGKVVPLTTAEPIGSGAKVR